MLLDTDTLTPADFEVARKAVEDMLIDWRDSRLSEPLRGNGLVIHERDGTASTVIRFGMETAMRVGMKAIVEARSAAPPVPVEAGEGE